MAQEWQYYARMFHFIKLKVGLLFLILSVPFLKVVAQNDFTGVAKYKITVEGTDSTVTDSMLVVFGKQKVKIVLYLPDLQRTGSIVEKVFIDDFSTKKSLALNNDEMTCTAGTLISTAKYQFINTMKIGACNNQLCFIYKADSTTLAGSTSSVNCFGSIDYRNSYINNYSFLGIQPVIVDNRIIMDFVVTRPNGTRERIYISAIKRLEDVEGYFNLNGYKPGK